jgi:predicted AAA+ superfamily ATPase
VFIFFDEIQIVEKWEIFINQKLNEGYLVFITGSNASLLSKELGTHLTGRHLSLELHPFSYTEFLKFKNLKNNVNSFNDYLQTGGMPEYIKNNSGIILQHLVDDILYRNIAVRHNIRKKSKSEKSICDRPGYHQVKTTFTEDHGRQLENAVYLHLRRKHKEISYFNKNGACDFVVMNKGKVYHCVQVCYRLDDLNMKRELDGLKAAMDYFGMREGVIVTHDRSDLFEFEGVNINLIPVMEYMV